MISQTIQIENPDMKAGAKCEKKNTMLMKRI
jgi:hypothetical protein